jgi:cytochrome c6
MYKLIFSAIVLFSALNGCHSTTDDIAERARQAQNKHNGTGSTGPVGSAVFRNNCITCHGADGKLGLNGAKDLTASTLPLDGRIQIITNGRNLMTPFKALLSEAEIKAVAEYSLTLNPQMAK